MLLRAESGKQRPRSCRTASGGPDRHQFSLLLYLALATPVAKTCDAGGGALRSERREWPAAWNKRARSLVIPLTGVPNRNPSGSSMSMGSDQLWRHQ